MFTSRTQDPSAWQRLVVDSWDLGWRSLLVRRFVQHPVVDTVVPASGEQKLTLLLGGQKQTAVRHRGGWAQQHLRAGSLSLTAAGRPTAIRWRATSPEPLDHLALHLPPSALDHAAAELGGRTPDLDGLPDAFDVSDPLLPRLLVGALSAATHGAPDLYAESLAQLIAVHLLVRHARLPEPPVPRSEDRRVRLVEDYLHDHLADPVTLADLAAVTGLSRYHLLRVFQQHTGETPNQRLTKLRMESARVLLSSGAAVADTARACGYADPSPFARAFRRAVGCSPSAYRRLTDNARPAVWRDRDDRPLGQDAFEGPWWRRGAGPQSG